MEDKSLNLEKKETANTAPDCRVLARAKTFQEEVENHLFLGRATMAGIPNTGNCKTPGCLFPVVKFCY